MKHLVDCILESLATLNITMPNIDSFNEENMSNIDTKTLGRFLKGTDHLSGLTVQFRDEHKFLHIHRYSDMHHMELTFVYNDSQNWPSSGTQWKDTVKYTGSDERDSMKNLLKDFFGWFEEHKKEIID